MISGATDRIYRRPPQLKLAMDLTSEQAGAMQAWAEAVPTLHFLDICVAAIPRLSPKAIAQSPRKATWRRRLRRLDRPHNSVSYLFALIERASEVQSKLNGADLEREILKDVAALRSFFKHARVLEPDDFLIGYLRKLRGVPHEVSRPSYLAFLEEMNGRHQLWNSVKPSERFHKAQEIVEMAESLSIAKNHPVVTITLACLYGNGAAKHMMKFKQDPDQFKVQNALSDIMVISRFARHKLEIEEDARKGLGRYAQTRFMTDDDGLIEVLSCFEAISVRFEDAGEAQNIWTEMTVHLQRLLSDLTVANDDVEGDLNPDDQAKIAEYNRICELVGLA